MNDTEFFEFLNLYLDHEISTADAARLESEVQNNHERRGIYQQYCRMQKACRLVAADFQAESAAAAVLEERKVVAFNPVVAEAAASRRKRMAGLYTVGTFAAAAACVAFIFASRTQPAASSEVPASSPVAVVEPAQAIAVPDATFVAGKSAAPRGLVSVAPRPHVGRDPLLLTGNSQADAVFAAAVHQANSQLAWIEAVQLAPLPQRMPTDLHFVSTLQTEGRALGNRSSTSVRHNSSANEMVGFQFVK